MLLPVLLAGLLPGPHQSSWLEPGRAWIRAWRSGRVDLQAPLPLDRPRFLDPSDPRIRALVKARGRYFYWSSETELSFLCTGLAADVSGKGPELLLDLALTHKDLDPSREWKARDSGRKQPWLVRALALEALGRVPGLRPEVLPLLGEKEGLLAPLVALDLLARWEEVADQDRIHALLKSPPPLLRAAALKALARMGGTASLRPVSELLEREKVRAVRCRLWQSAGPLAGTLGEPGRREAHPSLETLVEEARRGLADPRTPLPEKNAICRFLWTARPLGILRHLPDLLAAFQGEAPGEARLRWWIHGLLVDMQGRGTGLRRGTGFHAGPREPVKWKAFLEGRRELRVLKRGRNRARPPYPADLPRLFGLPVQGSRLLFLMDASAAFAGPWHPRSSRGKNLAPEGEEGLEIGDRIKQELGALLQKLPGDCGVRLVSYARRQTSLPKRGFLRLNKQGRARARTFLEGLRASGEADHGGALFRVFGLKSGFPPALAEPGEEPPDAVYWLPLSAPREGRVRSPRALVDLVSDIEKSHPLPIHVGLFKDQRPRARKRPLYHLVIAGGLGRSLRRLGEETLGSWVFVQSRGGR